MAGGQTEQEGKLPEFVERRRAALERYLIRTAIHPIFQVDPDFREFLECGMFQLYLFNAAIHALIPSLGITEDELPRASNTSALSGAGVLRLFNRMGETVTKIAFKMGESDPVRPTLTSFFISSQNVSFFNLNFSGLKSVISNLRR